MSAHIYVIAGGPGSGKTTLLNYLKKDGQLNSFIPPKYSTRKKRDPKDDIVTIDDIDKEHYDFIYSMNENFYAFKIDDIVGALKEGRNVFLILSDIRVLQLIKAYFGEFLSIIYLYRNMSSTDLDLILDERQKNKLPISSAEKRIRGFRLYQIQRQYVENISLFEHVILNSRDRPDEMVSQLKNIVVNNNNDEYIVGQKGPVIFLIAAGPGAGKRTLNNAMYTLGKNSIIVIPKETNRGDRPNDGKEIVTNISNAKSKYSIGYTFNDKDYGIDEKLIWNNLKYGLPQIVITNMQQFPKFKKIFGTTIVNVYLHATRTREELLQRQKEKEGSDEEAHKALVKVDETHQNYVDNIHNFHHVLLNTIEKEDLWEQMFRLIKHYSI